MSTGCSQKHIILWVHFVKKLPLEVQHDALVPSGRCKGNILKNDIFFLYMHKFLNQHDSGMLTQ